MEAATNKLIPEKKKKKLQRQDRATCIQKQQEDLGEAKQHLKTKEEEMSDLKNQLTQQLKKHQELVTKCSQAQALLRYYKGKTAKAHASNSISTERSALDDAKQRIAESDEQTVALDYQLADLQVDIE